MSNHDRTPRAIPPNDADAMIRQVEEDAHARLVTDRPHGPFVPYFDIACADGVERTRSKPEGLMRDHLDGFPERDGGLLEAHGMSDGSAYVVIGTPAHDWLLRAPLDLGGTCPAARVMHSGAAQGRGVTAYGAGR